MLPGTTLPLASPLAVFGPLFTAEEIRVIRRALEDLAA